MTGLKSAQIAKSIGKQFHFHNKEVRGNISLDLVSFKCIPTYILTGVGATDALLEKERKNLNSKKIKRGKDAKKTKKCENRNDDN